MSLIIKMDAIKTKEHLRKSIRISSMKERRMVCASAMQG